MIARHSKIPFERLVGQFGSVSGSSKSPGKQKIVTIEGVSTMIGTATDDWKFEEIVLLSGYRNVVTTNFPPAVWLHDGDSDERVVTNEVASYYLSSRGLPAELHLKARHALHRLHELGDWAAGEIVERHLRDQERIESGYFDRKPRLTVPQMLVRRFVKNNPGSAVAEISLGSGLTEPDVADILVQLGEMGIVACQADPKSTYELSASELERYLSPVD